MPPVAAIVYADSVYPQAAVEAVVAQCRSCGLVLAGVLQHHVSDKPERRCDIVLEDLSCGTRTSIYEDRGNGASGCKLDEIALTDAASRVERHLECDPDVLVLNKFGKAESLGGGLLDLIATAINRQVTVVIAVPQSHLAAWRVFAGEFARELPPDPVVVRDFVRALAPRSAKPRHCRRGAETFTTEGAPATVLTAKTGSRGSAEKRDMKEK